MCRRRRQMPAAFCAGNKQDLAHGLGLGLGLGLPLLGAAALYALRRFRAVKTVRSAASDAATADPEAAGPAAAVAAAAAAAAAAPASTQGAGDDEAGVRGGATPPAAAQEENPDGGDVTGDVMMVGMGRHDAGASVVTVRNEADG